MRTILLAVLGGLAALVGSAGAAHADETVSLIWRLTGNNVVTTPADSSVLILDVIINADATDGSRGGEISIDYTNVGLSVGKLVVTGFTSDPDNLFPLDLIPTFDNGRAITGLGAINVDPVVTCVATSCRLATITFHKVGAETDNITLQSFYTAGEGVDFMPPKLACDPGTCGAAFGTAQVVNVAPTQCAIDNPVSTIVTDGRSQNNTTNKFIQHEVTGNILGLNTLNHRSHRIRVCAGTKVTTAVSDQLGIPTNTASGSLACNANGCQGFVNVKESYTSVSTGSIDTDVLTFVPKAN
jgi:hypothetical protein